MAASNIPAPATKNASTMTWPRTYGIGLMLLVCRFASYLKPEVARRQTQEARGSRFGCQDRNGKVPANRMFDRAKSPEAKGRKLRGGDLRLSDADRADAVRRLRVHESMGHLRSEEASDRIAVVDASKTPDEIAKLFADLPALPARAPSIERRISTQDRQDAIGLLEKAYSEGRIEADECAAAKDQVHAARTRSEIDAAFHGLSSPTRVAAAKTAANVTKGTAGLTTRMVAEGGRRAGKAFRRGVFAVGALMIGIILAFAGIGTGALVCFVVAVLLFVSSAISLATSTS